MTRRAVRTTRLCRALDVRGTNLHPRFLRRFTPKRRKRTEEMEVPRKESMGSMFMGRKKEENLKRLLPDTLLSSCLRICPIYESRYLPIYKKHATVFFRKFSLPDCIRELKVNVRNSLLFSRLKQN